MTFFNIAHGEGLTFRGLPLRFQREMGGGLLHFMVEQSGAPFQIDDGAGGLKMPDLDWLVEAFASGELKKPFSSEALPFARRLASELQYDHETAEARDPDVPMRRALLRELDAIGASSLSNRALEKEIIRLWAELPEKIRARRRMPGVKAVRRWLNEWGVEGHRPTHQLMSMRGKVPRAPRLPPVTLQLIHRAADWYWRTPKVSIVEAYARVCVALTRISKRRERHQSGAPLKWPSDERLRQQVRLMESFGTYSEKFGLKAAKKRFKANGRGLTATRFLQLGCMDHTQLDVFVLDGELMLPLGKPWITVLLDVRTRCVVGFVLSWEPPSLYAAMEVIKRANRPKMLMRAREPEFPVLVLICGKFDEIVVDNGRELSGTSFEDVAGDVGTSIRWCPAKEPTFKAIGERFFLTLKTLLIDKLPGSTLPPQLLRELGYDPAKDAVLTIGELEDLIWQAISYYHIEEHSELGRPPASLWEQDMKAHRIPVIWDDSALAKMAGAIKNDCRATRAGVRLFKTHYHDPNTTAELLNDLIGLEPVRNQPKGSASVTVKVKYNPADISEIHVWNERRKRYVTLPCWDEEYAKGLSLWHHKQIERWTREKGLEFSTLEQRMRARVALTNAILEHAPYAKFRQRRSYARVLNAPEVESTFSGDIALAFADARHDGMAPVIAHEPLASNRSDGGQTSIRPARKAKASATPTRKPPKGKPAPVSGVRPESEKDLDLSAAWEGFEL